MPKKTIICLGDGGLNPEFPKMDLYILLQAKKEKPKICFLPTASGDNEDYIRFFTKLFSRYSCTPTHLSLFRPHTADISGFLLSQDIIFVGGGHSKAMLGVWREWGLDKILFDAYNNGVILSGGSAGSVCWFDQCITDSIPGALTVMNCLGFLPYSNCPHFWSTGRRRAYSKFILNKEIKSGYAADDFAALHFEDGKLLRSVSVLPFAKTYYYSLNDNSLVKENLPTKWLF